MDQGPASAASASAAAGAVLVVLGVSLLGAVGYLATHPDAVDRLRGRGEVHEADYTPPADPSQYHHREYRWKYKGDTWVIVLDIPKSMHEGFRSSERPVETVHDRSGDYRAYAYDRFVTDPRDDAVMLQVAEALTDIADGQGWDDGERLTFVLRFVQSLPYTSDQVTSGFDEYPRYPIETLVDNGGGGDCEDTSVLYASLVQAMGFGAILVSPPAHMAVGVLASDDSAGTGYHYRGGWYLYAETTGDGYRIGELPEEYEGTEARIYPLDGSEPYRS